MTLVAFVACDKDSDKGVDLETKDVVESFETSFDGDFKYGYASDDIEFEYFYNQFTFEKPLDLTEVDHILVWGWGLEYKIPVNVTE